MYKLLAMISFTFLLCGSAFGYVDTRICNSPNFHCVVASDGRIIAIPRKYEKQSNFGQRYAYAKTFSRQDLPKKGGRNMIKVDLGNLTWSAYDGDGNLVRSGRASGGKSYCPDIGRSCRTVTGTYTIYTKKGSGCFSTKFPVGKGGAPMPYCMFFHRGFALHGSNDVPNHNASHGCVRLIPEDARWLNQNFVVVGKTRVSITY